MGCTDVGDDPKIWSKDTGYLGNLPPSIHSQLKDTHLMMVPNLEHRQRQSRLRIQVALIHHYGKAGGQDCGENLLGGGLAAGAGDTDSYKVWKFLDVGGSGILQGVHGVVHRHKGGCRMGEVPLNQLVMVGDSKIPTHQHHRGTLFQGGRHIGMAILEFPHQRNEHSSRHGAPAVCCHRGEAKLILSASHDKSSASGGQEFIERQ